MRTYRDEVVHEAERCGRGAEPVETTGRRPERRVVTEEPDLPVAVRGEVLETVAVRTDYRVKAGTGRDAPPVALWHTVLTLDASKEPVSLTLPDDPRLEIYALSSRNGSG